MGVPITDEPLVLSSRRVVLLSATVGTYYIAGFIWRLLTGMYGDGRHGATDALWSGLSQLAIELSIPACGYYGAMYSHRTLIFFYCGANIIFIIAAVIGFFRLLVILGSGSISMCKDEYESTRTTCDIMVGDSFEKYLLLSSLLILTFLGSGSFWAGRKLYQNLRSADGGEELRAWPLVGEVIAGGLASLAADGSGAIGATGEAGAAGAADAAGPSAGGASTAEEAGQEPISQQRGAAPVVIDVGPAPAAAAAVPGQGGAA